MTTESTGSINPTNLVVWGWDNEIIIGWDNETKIGGSVNLDTEEDTGGINPT